MGTDEGLSYGRRIRNVLSASPKLRAALSIAVIVVVCWLLSPLYADRIAREAPSPVNGRVDFAEHGPLVKPVRLGGEWRLTWRGGDARVAPGFTTLVDVPGPWTQGARSDRKLPPQGAATYSLIVAGLEPGNYDLHLGTVFAASAVRIDGRLVSTWGRTGLSAATSVDYARAHDVSLTSTGRPISIDVEVSTFRSRHSGFSNTPILGLVQAMRAWNVIKLVQEVIFPATLILLTVYGLVVFIFRPSDPTALFLALSNGLLLPTAAVLGHDNLLLIAFPTLSSREALAIQYLTEAVSIMTFLAYVRSLFPQDGIWLPFWLIQGAYAALFCLFAGALIVGDELAASNFDAYEFLLMLTAFAYALVHVAIATARGRDGSVVFMFGLSLYVATLSIYALLVNNAISPADVPFASSMPLGHLALLIAQLVTLAERWSLAIEEANRTSDDLRRLLYVNTSIASEINLRPLLEKVVKVATKVVNADRSSLFLHNPKRKRLESYVAEGVDDHAIEMKVDEGLAGHSFSHGVVLNVSDAYRDPRFNPAFDPETGYRTQSVLSVPVLARDGRRLGVMQALNRKHSPSFNPGDVERMTAFAAQAAIAIDNATLFSEVVSSRNYNESILRSMSSGVLTCDLDCILQKVNEKALEIFRLDPARVEGRAIGDVLGQANVLLVEAVEHALRDGSVSSLLDIELVRSDGAMVSANAALAPLIGESGPEGVLLIVEDISEGKRLEGTMLRFMTREVVEQVLGRGDDALFGTACQASVLFADIRGFTTIAEGLQPRETVELLNEVLAELVDAVGSTGGVLDKFIGDAVMAVYGAPLSSDNDALNAVCGGMEMLRLAGELNRKEGSRCFSQLQIGVGIATGEVIAGTIGSMKRMEYTVIGDSVNLAARLQDTTKFYKVGAIVCETTASLVSGRFDLRELDLIRVRGRQRPEKIFQVLADSPGDEAKRGFEAYRVGRLKWTEAKWDEAVAAFEQALRSNARDHPSTIMLQRARKLAARPPRAVWDGIWPHDR